MYKPPKGDFDSFLAKVTEALDNIKSDQVLSYIAGDFNLDLMLADKTKNTRVFIDLMASFTFLPLVTKPTRVTSSTASIIDNIFTNDQAFKHNTTIILTDISDHYPVITNVTTSSIAIKKGIKYIR